MEGGDNKVLARASVFCSGVADSFTVCRAEEVYRQVFERNDRFRAEIRLKWQEMDRECPRGCWGWIQVIHHSHLVLATVPSFDLGQESFLMTPCHERTSDRPGAGRTTGIRALI